MFRTMPLCALVTITLASAALAQQQPSIQPSPIKRIVLQKFDVPGTNYETVIGIAEIAPNVNIGRHTHPGPESGYMLEGEFVLLVEGKPDQTVKAGESYAVPPGAKHDARTGDKPTKVLATYVVEKDKPLATPAP